MKFTKIVPSIMAATLCLTFAAGAYANEKREEKPRFKGVELYSWIDDGEKWVFVMLDATNRLKSTDEVKKAKNQLKGTGAVKKAFTKLAVEERVYWLHPIEGFEFPPKAIRKEIASSAKEAKVKLTLAGRDE